MGRGGGVVHSSSEVKNCHCPRFVCASKPPIKLVSRLTWPVTTVTLRRAWAHPNSSGYASRGVGIRCNCYGFEKVHWFPHFGSRCADWSSGFCLIFRCGAVPTRPSCLFCHFHRLQYNSIIGSHSRQTIFGLQYFTYIVTRDEYWPQGWLRISRRSTPQ